MKQTKIIIATGIFPPQIGGPATYSKLLRDELPARGFDVTVVNFGDVRRLPKVIRHIVYFFKILFYSVSTDIIYAQDPASVGLPVMLASKILRKKFYLKVVGDYAWEQGVQRSGITDNLDTFSSKNAEYPFFVRLLKRVQYLVATSADKVITPSEYLKKIITNWGVPAEKITVIYNGFDAPALNDDKEDLRKKIGIKGYTILSVGRLVPWKGFTVLIEMMQTLVKEIPEAHLLIVGDGPDRKMLDGKINELNLGKYITLVGKLSQEKLFEYIKASDVFVLNTAYEGFSHQILEVMSLGTPIVTTAVGGNTEVIENRKSGILIGYNDKVALEEAIKELHTDIAFAEKIAKTAQKKVKEWSKERMLEATSRILGKENTHGLNILSISSDRKLFEPGSSVRSRTLEYGRLTDELHIIVFAKKSHDFKSETFPPNIFLYSTNAHTRLGYIPHAVWQALKLKKQGVHIDVVTTQDPFESGLAGLFITRFFGAKLHLQVHTDFMSPHFAQESLSNRIRVMLAKFLLPRADSVRVVSERTKRSVAVLVKQKTPVTVLPIFADTTLRHDERRESFLKKKYPQFDFHIVMASRLTKEKNIQLALKAMVEVLTKYPKTGLVIVGSGPEEEYLKKMVNKLNLAQNVMFEGWQEDLSQYLYPADAFLLTSNYEGYGMVVVEALLAGCPVVMTDVGCAGEVVLNGKNGLVVPVADHEALIRAIMRVVSHGVDFDITQPTLPTKEEYLTRYRASWEDALSSLGRS